MRQFKLWMMVAATAMLFASCSEDELTSNLQLDFNGLPDLGADARYEGWLIVDGNPVSSGIFTSDGNSISPTSFEIDQETLDNASTFVLTIEPAVDPDPAPSDVHILAGDFAGANASLEASHAAALGIDYTSLTGTYILATPTTVEDTDELSGVWFLDNSSGAPEAGLDFPDAPTGWIYEGWAVVDGTPVSTGTFSTVQGADLMAPYSGTEPGPPFPGEDFINGSAGSVNFPVALTGQMAVISIEPVPDNDPAPFAFKPLASMIPDAAAAHTAYSMDNNTVASFPTGTASR